MRVSIDWDDFYPFFSCSAAGDRVPTGWCETVKEEDCTLIVEDALYERIRRAMEEFYKVQKILKNLAGVEE